MVAREDLLTERPKRRRPGGAGKASLLEAAPACGSADQAAWPPQLLRTFRERLQTGPVTKTGHIPPLSVCTDSHFLPARFLGHIMFFGLLL